MRHAVEAGRLIYLNIEDMPPLFSQPVLIGYKGRELDAPHEEFVRILKLLWRHLLVS